MTGYDFYRCSFGGSFGRDEISSPLKAADRIVRSAITAEGGQVSEEKIRTAVCIQAEHMAERSDYLGDGVSSVKLGDLSITADGSGRNGNNLCDEAAQYMEKWGLLYRGGVIS